MVVDKEMAKFDAFAIGVTLFCLISGMWGYQFPLNYVADTHTVQSNGSTVTSDTNGFSRARLYESAIFSLYERMVYSIQ